MAQAPEILLDRRSGRSNEEFDVEQDLTFKERVALFEQAEMSQGYAEAQLTRGYSKQDVYGETREIEEAIKIFQESAEFHADRIDEQEIVAALENEQIDPSIADAIRQRQMTARQREKQLDQRAADWYDGSEFDRNEGSREPKRSDEQER